MSEEIKQKAKEELEKYAGKPANNWDKYITLANAELVLSQALQKRDEGILNQIDGFHIDEKHYKENSMGLKPELAIHYEEVRVASEAVLNFMKGSLRAYIKNSNN